MSVPIHFEDCFENFDTHLVGSELGVSFLSACRTETPVNFTITFGLFNDSGRIGLFDAVSTFAVTLRTASILSDIAAGELGTSGMQICHFSSCQLMEDVSLSFHLERVAAEDVLRSVTVIEVVVDRL